MEKRKTNLADSFIEHPDLYDNERKLMHNLSYLDPKIAEYMGRDEFRRDQVMGAYFRLENKINSKKELEEKLRLENIISDELEVKIEETIKNTEFGKMYFLTSKDLGSKLAVYFINPRE